MHTQPNPASGVEVNPQKITIYVGSTVEDEGFLTVGPAVLKHLIPTKPDVIKVIRPVEYFGCEDDLEKAKAISPVWIKLIYALIDWEEYILIPIKVS